MVSCLMTEMFSRKFLVETENHCKELCYQYRDHCSISIDWCHRISVAKLSMTNKHSYGDESQMLERLFTCGTPYEEVALFEALLLVGCNDQWPTFSGKNFSPANGRYPQYVVVCGIHKSRNSDKLGINILRPNL